MGASFDSCFSGALVNELDRALRSVDRPSVEELRLAVLQARRIHVAGAGRSGLVAGCFAMRLMQLGLNAALAGEATAPAVGSRDLLLLVSGSGNTESMALYAAKARRLGAKVALVTVAGTGRMADSCDLVVSIPAAAAKDTAGSVQPLGSLFEQSALLLFDLLVTGLMEELGETPETMRRRHANLE